MIWAFAVVAVATLYLALRFKRFQSWVEPVLTITVAIGLASAALIWLTDSRSVVPEPVVPRNAIAPEEIVLSDLQFTVGQPVTSYRVTGTVTNNSTATLQSLRLTITLANCPGGACTPVGTDSGMVLVRVLPGQSQPFTTFAVFTGSDLVKITDPQWSWSVSDVRALPRSIPAQ
ncbi:hypothetical protein GGQ64_000631 [Rhizobium azooxidifex]|uniref:DUF3426 domain-containing protein n=1 Tax=Mycoplana azooxidifex TaxID=1636188 RepID=A0A7W6GHI7_9HYPH|nr:hypothetical protein [Mycoplana azooxidifex]MBB3975455.1 hypothetical protein [Mycoplana azooxidifex]